MSKKLGLAPLALSKSLAWLGSPKSRLEPNTIIYLFSSGSKKSKQLTDFRTFCKTLMGSKTLCQKLMSSLELIEPLLATPLCHSSCLKKHLEKVASTTLKHAIRLFDFYPCLNSWIGPIWSTFFFQLNRKKTFFWVYTPWIPANHLIWGQKFSSWRSQKGSKVPIVPSYVTPKRFIVL